MLKMTMIVMLAGFTCLPCFSQTNGKASSNEHATESPKDFYQLNFVIREVENERVINSRSYSMIMLASDNERRSSIRAGEKVPFTSTSGANTQSHQIDVGVNIDCYRMEEIGNRVSLNLSAEVSSMVDTHESNSAPVLTPVIRNNRWDSRVILSVNQPTILFSSDDPASKRKMQLQLTVTPLH